ncbi:unnamed protein product, partial [Larinioides sclopetarius]
MPRKEQLSKHKQYFLIVQRIFGFQKCIAVPVITLCKSGEVFHHIFSNTSHEKGILKRLKEIDNSFLICSMHSKEFWELIINLYAKTMLYNKLKIFL